MHAGRHLLGDLDAQPAQLRGLVGVVAEQPDPPHAERAEHLRRRRVVALVLAAAQRDVRLEGVQAALLQRVRVELGVEPDAAALLAQVEQEPADCSVIRSTASRNCGPQSQRSLPNTSPVRHSLCGRTRGARAAGGRLVSAALPVAERQRHVLLAVDEAVERVIARAIVAKPSGERSGQSTDRRTAGFHARPACVGPR